MSEIIKEYSNDDLTVIWQHEKCIHSEKCFHGLSDVFNPKNRPWVNMGGASSIVIKNQVDKCPSGALSYKVKNEDLEKSESLDREQIIEVAKDGPLMVYGALSIKHQDGTEESKQKVTAFCRCGASGNKPFCDGSHKKIEFRG